MKSAYVFTGLLLLFCAAGTKAQQRSTLGVQYQYGMPAGAFKKEFMDKGSPRGLVVDLMYALNPQWRVGAGVAYQDFYQKSDRNTYRMNDGSDISAVVTNSLQTTALTARAMYLPMGADSSRLQPYLVGGAGINMVQYSQLLGEFNNGQDLWLRFAAVGGAGLSYALGPQRRTALSLGVTYNYTPINKNDLKNVNYLGVQAGVRLLLRNSGRSSRGDVWQQRRPNHYDRNW